MAYKQRGGSNPLQKNFPSSFKQEMTEDEIQANIQQAMEFNDGKGAEVSTISRETMDRAKELGLIDGLGNANEILKEKFGDDIVIKKFEKPKSWFSKKLSSSICFFEIFFKSFKFVTGGFSQKIYFFGKNFLR